MRVGESRGGLLLAGPLVWPREAMRGTAWPPLPLLENAWLSQDMCKHKDLNRWNCSSGPSCDGGHGLWVRWHGNAASFLFNRRKRAFSLQHTQPPTVILKVISPWCLWSRVGNWPSSCSPGIFYCWWLSPGKVPEGVPGSAPVWPLTPRMETILHRCRLCVDIYFHASFWVLWNRTVLFWAALSSVH